MTESVAPEKQAGDDVLLLHGMMCMIYADGQMDHAEKATLNAFYMTLPEYEGTNFNVVFNDAAQVCKKYDSMSDSLNALKELSSPEAKKKCFVLAVDIALASGDVDSAEDEMLEAMQRILEIDEEFAVQTINTLSTKYALAKAA